MCTKRIIALLAAMLILSTSTAMAETTGTTAYSDMSFTELVETYQAFIAEFNKRSGTDYAGKILYDGVQYTVGADIAPGVYRCIVLESIPDYDSPRLFIRDPVRGAYSRLEYAFPLPFELVNGATIELVYFCGVLIPVTTIP